jgi:uncharacterized protein (DUF1330 family)
MPSSLHRPSRRSAGAISRAAPPPSRTRPASSSASVISEFPSVEKAIAAHDSPAYQHAVEVLGNGAVRDLRIVEGLE